MSNKYAAALELAHAGFHVFPLVPNTKLPAIKDFTKRATDDPDQVAKWWEKNSEYNIGIATSKYANGRALVVVDVDTKNGKDGIAEMKKLAFFGKEFPSTSFQKTPSGGLHIIYQTTEPVKQGTDVLARGLDVRSRGGFIVGAGSTIDGKEYKFYGNRGILEVPHWIKEQCGRSLEKKDQIEADTSHVNQSEAIKRACKYLLEVAPIAVEGQSGDATTFKVACAVKDFGLSKENAFMVMAAEWNDRCDPPWEGEDLWQKIVHAYRYGTDSIGAAAPELVFEPITPPENEDPVKHPIQKLNEEYAFVTSGGGYHILHETTDANGKPYPDHLSEAAFHKRLVSRMITIAGETKPLTQIWMKDRGRRSYKGICFKPGLATPEGWYNLWRGFTVEPVAPEDASVGATKSLQSFLEHALNNICGGDPALCKWLIGYFAHLVQKPWEKPLTSLVFKGKKGTGKNALVERVGHLLGSHFIVTSDRRYLVGNFNGFLENNLMFVLDEAFWSGDKQAEGVLKNLITGKMHVIEHKGKEPYSVDNCTRVVIIGNEDWLVPATQDERRFAVFNVGDGRKQDNKFFRDMRVEMENGGYAVLLHYLLHFDLSEVDVNSAPQTEGLLDQKLASLAPLHQWWLECLRAGTISNSGFGGGWPEFVDKTDLRAAFQRFHENQNIRARVPNEVHFGRQFHECAKNVTPSQRREGEHYVKTYTLPKIEAARKDFEDFIGHRMRWEN